MARKKGKSVSFDAMVKFFMQSYGIPTKKDVEKVIDRLDRLEILVKKSSSASVRQPFPDKKRTAGQTGQKGAGTTASDQVMGIIKRSKNGVGFSDIQKKTGYPEKKLRNIIFRLNRLQKITRKERGIYTTL